MPNDRAPTRHSDLPDMSADLIAGRRFGQAWRGYDPDEVKQFLDQVANQVRNLRERLEHAEAGRRDAEQRASHPRLDEATLMAAVGEETAGILRSARSASAEITAKAEATSKALIDQAQSQADALVSEAGSLLALRTAEAQAVATELQARAEADAAALQDAAEHERTTLMAAARAEHDEMVQAAHAVREKILTDLARRRKLATVQIEQLRAGRERLLDAYMVVRRTLDDVTEELQRADAEARAASDAVGRQHGTGPGELVDLRGEDVWTSAATEPRTASPEAPEPRLSAARATDVAGASSALVRAPKVTELAAGGGARATVARASAPGPGAEVEDQGQPARPPLDQVGANAPVQAGDAIESVRVLRDPVPEAAVPETAVPEAAVPETAVPEAAVPETAVPETAVPETAVPETAVPEAGGGPSLMAVDGASGSQGDVQSLFARIRASREEAATTARRALAQDAAGTSEPAAPAGAPEAATGTSVETAPDGAPAAAQSQFFAKRDEIATRLEGSLARRLKRALQDEQNSLLDRLRSAKGIPTADAILPGAEEQPDRFVEAGRPLLEEAARAGGQLAAEMYGGSGSARALGPEVVEDLADELGRSITEPLRQRLEAAFGAPGDDSADVAEALGAAYREWKTQRIEAAAHDQVAAALSRGAYLALPGGGALRWVVSAAEGPCPDCDDNALAGGQRKGEAWPTGQLYPPAHPGCRCALAPVVPVAPAVRATGQPRALASGRAAH